jgi:uncharacterized OsmC-like protein
MAAPPNAHAGSRGRRSEVGARQAALRRRYEADPGAALVTDRGRSLDRSPGDALHGAVVAGAGYERDLAIPVGVHRGVGGLHDAPNPGELLCATLAACQDSTLRLVADLLGVRLASLAVEVSGRVDLRGVLGVDRAARVGFGDMRCSARLEPAPGADPRAVRLLVAAAERSCIVLDTLRRGVEVVSAFEVARAPTA